MQYADRAGEHSEDAGLLAIRNQPGGRRLRVEATVAREAVVRPQRGELTFEPKDAAGDQRLVRKKTGVIDQIAGRKIIGSVKEQIVISDQAEDVVGGDVHRMDLDGHIRIERREHRLS